MTTICFVNNVVKYPIENHIWHYFQKAWSIIWINKTTAVVWSPAALHQKVGKQHIWQNSFKLNSFAWMYIFRSYVHVRYALKRFGYLHSISKKGVQGLTLTLCFSTGWFEALPKVGEWVIWEKLAICNTSRDNSHILIFSRRVISYGSETSPCESSSKSRWMSYLRKIGYLQYF